MAHPAFVKPATGKAFVARVYPTSAELPGESQRLAQATPILVAEPVRWEIEFRFFCPGAAGDDRLSLTAQPHTSHASRKMMCGRARGWEGNGTLTAGKPLARANSSVSSLRVMPVLFQRVVHQRFR